MEYRYMIWNDVQKSFQFPSICETSEKGALTLLFKKIENDARKYRFQIKKVEKNGITYFGYNNHGIIGIKEYNSLIKK